MTAKSKELLPYTRGMLLVLSGPSGVGKNTLVDGILNSLDGITYSISATTRKPRDGEQDGVDYFFLSETEFKERIQEDEFLEWAEVYGNFYGTPISYIENMLKKGMDVILDIDIQGAASIRRKIPDGVLIFVLPPSAEKLFERLRRRGTEDENAILNRMKNIPAEISSIPHYDYVIVNDDIEDSTERLKSIILAERSRVKRLDLLKLFESFEEEFKNEGGLSATLQIQTDVEKALR